jgi:hypothetical protein
MKNSFLKSKNQLKKTVKFIYTVKLKLNMKWITIYMYSILIMKTENFYVKWVYRIIFLKLKEEDTQELKKKIEYVNFVI